jgi:hypothetical protein
LHSLGLMSGFFTAVRICGFEFVRWTTWIRVSSILSRMSPGLRRTWVRFYCTICQRDKKNQAGTRRPRPIWPTVPRHQIPHPRKSERFLPFVPWKMRAPLLGGGTLPPSPLPRLRTGTYSSKYATVRAHGTYSTWKSIGRRGVRYVRTGACFYHLINFLIIMF